MRLNGTPQAQIQPLKNTDDTPAEQDKDDADFYGPDDSGDDFDLDDL